MARPRKPPEDLIEFGRVAGAYGVRGWLKALADEPELLAAEKAWWIEGVERAVEDSKLHSGTVLAKLAGIETPEAARALKGKPLQVRRPDPGEGRHYWGDLVGLEVVNRQGQVLGVVKRMFSNGAHDVMALAGERERLLPWVPAYVKKVDLANRRIEVDWQEDW